MRSGYAISAPKLSLSDLQKEINNLSLEERELIHNEIYGFMTDTIMIETDEIIRTGLDEMENILQDILMMNQNTILSSSSGHASSSAAAVLDSTSIRSYIHAYEVVPTFVSDPQLRIQFLRCELYNTKNAAIRYIKYWKERIWLWGEEKAFRKITIQDFDDEDQVALLLGGYQLCPSLDSFQRGIIISNLTKCDLRTTHRKSQLRQMWYIHEAALENEFIQKNGIVSLPGLGLRRESLLEHDRKYDLLAIQIMSQAFPIRIIAIHHVVSNIIVQYGVPFVLYLLGSNLRKRYKCHIYSCSIYDVLQQYGIKRNNIPQEFGGTHPTYTYTEWLESRRAQNL